MNSALLMSLGIVLKLDIAKTDLGGSLALSTPISVYNYCD
jgi:hypothetical protein